jgi:hypothetical protein
MRDDPKSIYVLSILNDSHGGNWDCVEHHKFTNLTLFSNGIEKLFLDLERNSVKGVDSPMYELAWSHIDFGDDMQARQTIKEMLDASYLDTPW